MKSYKLRSLVVKNDTESVNTSVSLKVRTGQFCLYEAFVVMLFTKPGLYKVTVSENLSST